MRVVSWFAIALVLSSLPGSLLAQTPYVFEVDTTRSVVELYVEASPAGVSDSDETSARLAGTVTALLTPGAAPFSQIQVSDISLTLHDALSLRLDYGTVAGRLDITAPIDEINLALTQAGEPAAVVDSNFTQTNNIFFISGTLDLDATGIISLGIGNSAELGSELAFDVAGSITQTGDQLRLLLPLDIENSTEISGVPLDIRINGTIVSTSTVVATAADDPALPAEVALAQNYPNPFNPRTSIAFTLSQAGPVSLQVFDAMGRLVATLADGVYAAGPHEAVFTAADLPSGLYVYRLAANGQVHHRTMVLLK